jgi:hypothetical protein
MFFPMADRIFPGETRHPDQEAWFFRAREGVNGPYPNRDEAVKALQVFIKRCIEKGETGGRDRHWSAPTTLG